MSGCLRKQVVYLGLILIDFDPFWFLFPIHKVGVPLLLLYVASEFKTDCRTLQNDTFFAVAMETIFFYFRVYFMLD